jgi:hypothetical protein
VVACHQYQHARSCWGVTSAAGLDGGGCALSNTLSDKSGVCTLVHTGDATCVLLCCTVACCAVLCCAAQVALQWMIQRDVGGLAGAGPSSLPSLAQEGPAHQL